MLDKPIEINHFRILLDAQKVNEHFTLYKGIYDYSGFSTVHLNALFLRVFDVDSVAIKIISSLIIFINAFYINNIVDKYRLIEERSFLPGLIYVVLSFSVYQNLSLNAVLIGNFFTCLGFSSLLKMGLEQADVVGKSFGAGIYLGLAFITEQMFILYLIVGLIALQYFSSRGLKGYVNLVLGFTFPPMLLFMWYLFFGNQDSFFEYFVTKYFFNMKGEHLISFSTYLPWLIFSITFLILFIGKRSSLSFKNYVSKSHQLFIFWLLIGGAYLFFTKDWQLSNVYVFVAPLSFIMAFYLINLRKNWMKEVYFLLIIAFAVVFNFQFFRLSSKEDLDSAFVQKSSKFYDGKILALENNLSIYNNNQHGSAFTNWQLEKATFLNLEKDGNLEKIYLGITADYPKYIVDPNGIFDRVVKRIPLLKKKYKKVDASTYRLN